MTSDLSARMFLWIGHDLSPQMISKSEKVLEKFFHRLSKRLNLTDDGRTLNLCDVVDREVADELKLTIRQILSLVVFKIGKSDERVILTSSSKTFYMFC